MSDTDNQVQLPVHRLLIDRENGLVPELNSTSGRACVLTSVYPEPLVLDPIPDNVGDTRLPHRGP